MSERPAPNGATFEAGVIKIALPVGEIPSQKDEEDKTSLRVIVHEGVSAEDMKSAIKIVPQGDPDYYKVGA